MIEPSVNTNVKPELSSTSLIVYRMLAESKQGEMLSRLKVKLGATKAEIYKLISEL